jgi:hypothetical protein
MRAISTSVLAALIIAALFWGNCFSCPQLLLAQAHSCCHKSKPDNAKCQTQSLRHYVKADTADSVPAVTVAAAVSIPEAVTAVVPAITVPPFSSHTPPELIPLRV